MPRPCLSFETWWDLHDNIEDEQTAWEVYQDAMRDAEEDWVSRVA